MCIRDSFWPDTEILGVENEDHACYPYDGDKTNFGFNFKYLSNKGKSGKDNTNFQGAMLLIRHGVMEEGDRCVHGTWKLKSNSLGDMALGTDAEEDEQSGSKFGWAVVSGKANFRDFSGEETGKNTGGNPFLIYVEDHGDQGCGQWPYSDEIWVEIDASNAWPDPLGDDADLDDVTVECGNIVVPHETRKGKKDKP